MTSDYWVDILRQALDQLGGRDGYVPGATLSYELARLANRDGVDFRSFLRERGITFRQLLDEHQDIVDLHFVPPPHADMEVAFKGVPKPAADAARPSRQSIRLRQDAYQAFTRISAAPYVYVRSSDRFTTDAGDASDVIEVPPVSLDELIQQRRTYASALGDPDSRDRLLRSIDFSASPLASFQRTLADVGELRRWHEFNYNTIRKKIEDWAAQSNLEPSRSWFAPSIDAQRAETPQQVLSELARFLTDDEVRALAVPFRAVEEMYRSLATKRQ